MRYYLDAEFNGFGGQLLSLAPVPGDDGALCFYEVLKCHNPDPWVFKHVLPVPQNAAVTRDEMIGRLAVYLGNDTEPVVVSDWPEDLAHLALLMVTGSGWRMSSPRIVFEWLDLPLFDSDRLSSIPHNARANAMELRDHILSKISE